MTTVREPAAAAVSRTATPVEVPPSCRVSILAGDSHQIDLVLPSAVPLTTLVDPTVIAINKVLRGRGATGLPRLSTTLPQLLAQAAAADLVVNDDDMRRAIAAALAIN